MSLSGFTQPWWLLFLLAPAALLGGYVYVQRMRHTHALRFANLEMLESVAPKRPGRSRHVPTALLLVALVLLTVALAGPTAQKKVARNRATVILAIDVSLSMQATDVAPSRLAAAQEAAKAFADRLTPGINLGLVSFAGTASVLVSPTTDRNAVKEAIDHLQLAERTATGEAIFTSLQAIENLASALGGANQAPPARIVMESDGKQTVPQNLDDPRGAFTAAREAKKKGVPVSTISFGTLYGTVDIQGQTIPVPVDDASLHEIANLSGGTFFSASSLSELHKVYQTLEKQIGFETTRGDAGRPWLILGTVLVAVAGATALVLTRRLP
ncbi:VWA domain-containing protein [Rhodococcus sp. D2-41]|uniref:VWA domain-containing protein n=1 Tax=Speluncibacter jeojiensis TaxID=2710754 RepID=A0A9X4REU7_9ACTN|nr:VWA domain-containing protein [Rhodococcus sp. D2-41]MDG3011196.1 VWA domain-containing protein [Rhodococcus sp. D2-41]MDG3015953.1 VWA domain-containing protein [Corynebacteriales bacterium D3-21]